ncbi:MAG: hypothetical protein BM485_07285 [Desulfobulbaceae bacterium DB1]|nr:MAG: hypothetical protein BM485_07285 [Desulfobulbaceae bacterium DB1]
MKFADIKIGIKIIGGYLAICLIIFLTGLVGYQGMNSEKKAASVVDAGLEMMLAVRTDMQMIMELLASSSVEELEGAWQEHLLAVEDFKLFLTGIRQGAETEMGIVYPADDPQLLEKVAAADKLHNDHFLPAIEKIYSLTKKDFELAERHETAMTRFEKDFDAIIALAEALEVKIKERINSKLAAGDSAQAIIDTENSWADMAMEIKTTLAMSRIAIEEYAQSFDAAALPQIETEYRKEIARFDTWVKALLQGGETEMGKIAPVDVPELKKLVEQIDQFHDTQFAKNGEAILPLQKEMTQAAAERNILDSEIDEYGEKIM